MSYTQIYAVMDDSGDFTGKDKFQNSHGSAPLVWDILADSYNVRAETSAMGHFQPMSMDNWQELWKWDETRPDESKVMLPFERLTLHATYDRAVVRRDDILAVADAFDAFVERHRGRITWSQAVLYHTAGARPTRIPRGGESCAEIRAAYPEHCNCADKKLHGGVVIESTGRVCSLKEQAVVLRRLHAEGALAVAWQQTSVAECPWHVSIRNPETGEYDDERSYNINRDSKHHFVEVR